MVLYYNIANIETKSGELRSIHKDVLWRNCFLYFDCTGGYEIAWLICDVEYDPWKLHRLRTSIVEEVTLDSDGYVTIQTMNTKYVLAPGYDIETYNDLYNRCPINLELLGLQKFCADNNN